MPLVHTRMSEPTNFGTMPGLTAEEAAGVLCHAVVAKPVEISPWWSGPVQAWSDITRGSAQRIMSRSFRR